MNKILKIGVSIAAAAAITVATPFLATAWGPSRETFTIEKPATYVTFNSITNNPSYGDERNFLNICEYNTTTKKAVCNDTGSTTKWGDSVNVKNGKEYIVRLYVHNNAADNLGLKATNVLASIDLPTYEAKTMQMDSYLGWDSDGSHVNKIWDQVVFNSSELFSLSLVSGSVKYTSNAFTDGVTLSDSLIGSGVKISDGFDDKGNIDKKLDGEVHGCFKYNGWLTFRVKATTNEFSISKTVRQNGIEDKTLKESVSVKKGDKVDFQIYFKNTGGKTLEGVVIKDVLPAGLTYVSGSTKLKTASGVKTVADGITTTGLNIGNYLAGGEAYLAFTAEVTSDKCTSVKNTAEAVTKIGSKTDTATVVYANDCTEEPEEPEKPVTPPTTPTEMPKTGPASIVGAVVGVGSLATAGSYYIISRKKLN